MQRLLVQCPVLAAVSILVAAAAGMGIHKAQADPLSAWSSDFDDDGDVDLIDFDLFVTCFNGPNRPPPVAGCDGPDLDADADVDLSDFSAFAACFNGFNRPPACEPDLAPPGMVLVPAGESQMGDTFNEGDADERLVHAVYVDSFCMGATEVTNQQYAGALNWAKNQGNLITVIDGRVYRHNATTSDPFYCGTTTSLPPVSQVTWDGSTFGVTTGKEDYPMVSVSWYGAAAYCNWRSGMEGRPFCYDLLTWDCDFCVGGYRLPTEAEWERAARGGAIGRRFPWSDSDEIQHARANYYSMTSFSYDTSLTRGFHPTFDTGINPCTSPVAYFLSNDYGLYDMAGNITEWCNDWYSDVYYYASTYRNPRGPMSGSCSVVRGGCWVGLAIHCRVARRAGVERHLASNTRGFRCVVGAQ